MTFLLELELNSSLKATIQKLDEEESSISRKKQPELMLELWDKLAKNTAMARKSIRWPIGQVLPEEISYDDQKEVILLKGKTTKAEIPLPKSKIDSLTAVSTAKTSTSAKVKTFSTFAVNPIETNDIGNLSKSVESVIEGPLKQKRWKKLVTSLESLESGAASGALSTIEQSQLVEAIREFAADADTEQQFVDEILKSVILARILTYRNEDNLLKYCIEMGKLELVEMILEDEQRVVSEMVLANLLKLAAGKSEKRADLLKILSRNFSRKSMTEQTSQVLTTLESIEIMLELIDIYKSFEEPKNQENVAKKALGLITILMDAHGSRIIYEDELHQKFAQISNFIIEMQSLLGTFAKFETKNEVSKLDDDFSQKCIVRKIQLVKHKLAW
ncbi:unnamed protein product [Caenorhabditis angaria]|uniref:Uncharacterized protein n=1 Tax=Caenorhabditis angaria TaxID=860376 RepID=A0A9P1I9M8_9PELO|nr:unnamed protein product [Caenorhabditis angaria]